MSISLSTSPHPVPRRRRRPPHLILDWDGTVTVSDTTSLIIRSALLASAGGSGKHLGADSASNDVQYCVDAYAHDYNAWKASLTPPPTAEQAPSLAAELRRLDGLADIERRSFLRARERALERLAEAKRKSEGRGEAEGGDGEVEGPPLLAHMRREGARAVRCSELVIRDPDGLRRLLRWAEGGGGSEGSGGGGWSVVSVSWSREFMIGAMQEAGLIAAGPAEAERVRRRIVCNELLAKTVAGDKDEGTERLVQTVGQKFRAMRAVAERERGRDGVGGESESREMVYVGDSTTDLQCLLAADLGVCMRQGEDGKEAADDKLGQMLEKLGIACPHIADIEHVKRERTEKEEENKGRETRGGTVYWTTNFKDLLRRLEKASFIGD